MPAIDMDGQRLLVRLVAVFCLLLFFYLALTTALSKTATSDEPAHIVRAVTLSQTGDLRFQLGHTPFSHRLIGSLLFTDAQLPEVRQLSQWQTGDRLQVAAQLLWDSGINVERTLLLTRLPIVMLGVLLGAVIGSWALSWQGKVAMLLAMILFATSPNLIAHAALATTDLPTAVTYFAAVYAWWRYWRGRQIGWWLLAAAFLGLALATKLTAILLLPVLFLQALLYIGRGRDFWRLVWTWLGLLPVAVLVVWFIYGFEVGPFANWAFAVPGPSYLESWQSVLDHVGSGHQSYFWGDLSKRGWWFYFPVTFLIKTPLVTLLLLLMATVVIIRRRQLWRTALFLLIPVGALFAAAIVSKLNIGYRHILPALPFLLVYGTAAVLWLRRRRSTRILLAVGLAWALIGAIWQHPHHLAYFNPAVGGTAQGYRYLGDSNLDWGQDLKLLVETVTAGEQEWLVSYNGVSDPAYYGLPQVAQIELEDAWTTFAAANPPPGRYAISVNHLQGLIPDADLFDWFRRQKPVYHLGGSIQVYDIEEQAQGEWIAQCIDPTPLLTVEEAQTLLGQDDLRQLFFDCRQSLVMANDGQPGWFILPQSDKWWFQEMLANEALQLVYRHDAAAGTSSFDVYYWPGNAGLLPVGEWSLSAQTEAGDDVVLPYAMNDTVALAGYQVIGDHWLTQWQVTAQAEEPLSIQAHLYSTEAGLPQVADSLGFSSDQWQEGDWLLQRHEFPGQENGLFLQTGVYNFQTMETLGETVRLPGG